MRAIMGEVVALDGDFPADNARFLDGIVAAVRATTGRVHGATTDGRILPDVAPRAGFTQRSGSTTIQTVVPFRNLSEGN
ncbi:hypothetical protein AB3X96_37995 [Paraburkholderia sp. BR13439]|uniref:hypothetical protein n=1 Tax=unclassified Paraburkholderia TaxID=2615204 RepID=UPI0034CE96BE